MPGVCRACAGRAGRAGLAGLAGLAGRAGRAGRAIVTRTSRSCPIRVTSTPKRATPDSGVMNSRQQLSITQHDPKRNPPPNAPADAERLRQPPPPPDLIRSGPERTGRGDREHILATGTLKPPAQPDPAAIPAVAQHQAPRRSPIPQRARSAQPSTDLAQPPRDPTTVSEDCYKLRHSASPRSAATPPNSTKHLTKCY